MTVFETERLVFRDWTDEPGDATESARGPIRRAFAAGLTEAYAVVVRPGNHASVAVAGRLGMTPLGRSDRWYGGLDLDAYGLRRPGGPAIPTA